MQAQELRSISISVAWFLVLFARTMVYGRGPVIMFYARPPSYNSGQLVGSEK